MGQALRVREILAHSTAACCFFQLAELRRLGQRKNDDLLASNDGRVVHVIDNSALCLLPGRRSRQQCPRDGVSLQHEFGLCPEEWGRTV
jgi:hypothetical protein